MRINCQTNNHHYIMLLLLVVTKKTRRETIKKKTILMKAHFPRENYASTNDNNTWTLTISIVIMKVQCRGFPLINLKPFWLLSGWQNKITNNRARQKRKFMFKANVIHCIYIKVYLYKEISMTTETNKKMVHVKKN